VSLKKSFPRSEVQLSAAGPSSGPLFYQPDLLLLKCAKNSVRYWSAASGAPRKVWHKKEIPDCDGRVGYWIEQSEQRGLPEVIVSIEIENYGRDINSLPVRC
jgi:hypothetical protein